MGTIGAVEALGMTAEEIADVRKISSDLRGAMELNTESSGEDKLTQLSKSYLIWLIEKCDDVVVSIAKGDNVAKVAVHVGILRQEMSNIIPNIIRK